MCGIIGYINPTKKYVARASDLIADMLAMDTIRGEDSTGIFKVIDKKVHWIKDVVPGYQFVRNKEVHKFLQGIGNASFVVGHNRWATRGTVSIDNAHPFEYENVCLVHNGTVMRSDKLDNSKKKHDVDSAMITKSMSVQGIQATTNAMWGAYSLVWYDNKTDTLHFLRNKDRPMWFLTTKQGIIIFCSEPHLGQWAAVRRGFDVIKVESTAEDVLYSFDSKVDFDVPAEQPMKPEIPVYSPPAVYKNPAWTETADELLINRLKILAKTFREKDVFRFSLNDFDEEQKQGRFVRIFGESPWNNDVTCTGNYSGPVESLYEVKTLLTGVVTSIGVSKKLRKVVLGLKDITITGEPDPFFGYVIPKDLKPKEKPKVHLSVVSSKSCALCSHVFTRANGDDPYLITDIDGIAKIVCVSCRIDRPNQGNDQQVGNDSYTEKEVHSWH